MGSGKSYFAGLMAFIALFQPALTEGINLNPFNWQFCCPDIKVDIDYLCLEPCLDNLDYAALVDESSGTTFVDYKAVCPDWESGVRVRVDLPRVCRAFNLLASYTYLNSNTSFSTDFDNNITDDTVGVASPLVHPNMEPPFLFQYVDGKYKLKYQDWDLLLSFPICCNSCHTFSPYFGVAGINLQQHLDIDYVGDGILKWKSHYTGTGMKAGSSYTYKVDNNLRIFAEASGTLVVGNPHTKNAQDFDTEIVLDDDDCCLIMPGYYIAAGVVYELCLCKKVYHVRLGYEFLNWYNAPNPRVFSGTGESNIDVSHSTSSHTQAIGFHGILAGLSFHF